MKQHLKFGPFFLACGLLSIFIVFFMIHVNSVIKKVTNVDGLAKVFDTNKYDGLLIDKKALSHNDFLFIFDSSNLSNTDSPYHPCNIFTKKSSGFIPYLVGRNNITSIYHLLKIAALNDSIRNNKIVYIVEPLNFIGNDALGNDPFKIGSNLPGLHVYQFALNSKFDKDLKAKIAANLLKNVGIYRDPILTILLKNLTLKHKNQTLKCIFEPVGHAILDVLEQEDYFNAYHLIIENKRIPCQSTTQKANFAWPDLMKNAEKDGENACRTNNFSINDSAYLEKIKPNLYHYRNSDKKIININSKQINNTILLLRLFKELNIKPLIIIEPLNGYWSDYTGLPKSVRYQCYTQIRQMIQKSGFKCVDFSNHEYDKYFLRDTKHLGWKGWVYVDQEMARFYRQ